MSRRVEEKRLSDDTSFFMLFQREVKIHRTRTHLVYVGRSLATICYEHQPTNPQICKHLAACDTTTPTLKVCVAISLTWARVPVSNGKVGVHYGRSLASFRELQIGRRLHVMIVLKFNLLSILKAVREGLDGLLKLHMALAHCPSS